jgi:hypothetical protein
MGNHSNTPVHFTQFVQQFLAKPHATGMSTPTFPSWIHVTFSSPPELRTPWKVNDMKMLKQSDVMRCSKF